MESTYTVKKIQIYHHELVQHWDSYLLCTASCTVILTNWVVSVLFTFTKGFFQYLQISQSSNSKEENLLLWHNHSHPQKKNHFYLPEESMYNIIIYVLIRLLDMIYTINMSMHMILLFHIAIKKMGNSSHSHIKPYNI